jgi:RNA polymerase sigma-70 factor, ECF subfamily
LNEGNYQDVARWVLAAQNGSSEAFHNLHRRFVALVHGVLLSRFRPTIAEELTQECFLIAFRKLDQLREPAKFGPWIVTIARRVDAADERRFYLTEVTEEIIDPRSNPETEIDAAKVLGVIRTLPEAYRETLVLRLVEGMSGPEIADATGLSPDSVRVNLHRGMKQLREALAIDPKIEGKHP